MALPTKSEVGRGRVSYVQFGASYENAIAADAVNTDVGIAFAKARIGDVVEVSAEEETELIDLSGYVSANGVVTIKLINSGAEIVSGPSFNLNVFVFHRN